MPNIIQVTSDWTAYCTKDGFKDALGFDFTGPGLYTGPNYFFIVTPLPRNAAPATENIWHKKQPEGTLFYVQAWNCKFEESILSVLATIPTRTA